MTITLRRRPLTLALLLLAGVMVLLVLPPASGQRGPTDPAMPVAPPTDTIDVVPNTAASAPAQAAVQFMRAFYTADYRHRDQWLATLKPLSSSDGYTLLQNLIAPALWKDLERAQTVVTADQVTVEAGEVKAEGVSKLVGNTPWQIRAVTITLASEATWPGWTSTTHHTNLLLSHEAGWLEVRHGDVRRSSRSCFNPERSSVMRKFLPILALLLAIAVPTALAQIAACRRGPRSMPTARSRSTPTACSPPARSCCRPRPAIPSCRSIWATASSSASAA